MRQMTVDLVEDALATYRLTRLIAEDELTRPLRDKAASKLLDAGHHRLAYLISCPFCVSVYVATGVGLATLLVPRVWFVPRRILASAGLVALAHDIIDP